MHSIDLPPDDGLPPDLYPIRLQGPWELAGGAGREDAPGDTEPEWRRVTLPLAPDARAAWPRGACQLRRRFQRPTNLDREELVVLVLPAECQPTAVELNGVRLSDGRRLGARRVWKLSPGLERSNRLVLLFDASGPDLADGLMSPILLGIMPDADGSWWEGLPREGVPLAG